MEGENTDIEEILAGIEAHNMYENILDMTNDSQERLNEGEYGRAFQHAQEAIDCIDELTQRDPNMAEELKIYRKTAEENLARSKVLWENPNSGKTMLKIEEYAQREQYDIAEHLLKQLKSQEPKIE
jgi:hypothetical protein